MNLSISVLTYLCEEVVRQGDGPMQVATLALAWDIATMERRAWQALSPRQIETWGKMVKPEANAAGFRTGPVWVGDDEGAPAHTIQVRLHALCERVATKEWDAAKAYYEFEKIHPFRDGNGRTGKILYNYVLDTLDHPTLPPNFFGRVV